MAKGLSKFLEIKESQFQVVRASRINFHWSRILNIQFAFLALKIIPENEKNKKNISKLFFDFSLTVKNINRSLKNSKTQNLVTLNSRISIFCTIIKL